MNLHNAVVLENESTISILFFSFGEFNVTCICTYNKLTPWSRVLPDNLTGPQLTKNFPHFMGPEGLLPHSQQPATCLYPEPDRSSPCLQISLLEHPF